MTLQFGAISPERCFELLARVPDFRGITPAELDPPDRAPDQGRATCSSLAACSPWAQNAERIFGRKNFCRAVRRVLQSL